MRTCVLRPVVAIAVLVLGAWGCTPTIAIRSIRPAPVSVGASNHLVILDGVGRRSARETVYQEFINECRARGYFRVEDRSEEGVSVRIVGRRVVLEGVEGSEISLPDQHAGVRIDVLEWDARREDRKVPWKDADGNVHVRRVSADIGNVLLAVTIFDGTGRTLVAEKEYEGRCSTGSGGGCAYRSPARGPSGPPFGRQTDVAAGGDVLELAARSAIGQILDDITPTEVITHVRLDGSDPGQEYIIATAKAGNIAQAAHDARRYLERNPYSAAAAYNLAVFLEAMGHYSEALSTYDRALSLGNKSFYVSARAGCAQRLLAYESVSTDAEPSGITNDWGE